MSTDLLRRPVYFSPLSFPLSLKIGSFQDRSSASLVVFATRITNVTALNGTRCLSD